MAEQIIGVWRRSPFTGGFWWRTLFTLGLYYFLLWRRNQITLTNRRVTLREGNILSGRETTIDLSNITDITVSNSVLGAIFHYGDITIQSAGSSDSEIWFSGLAKPDKLRDAIFQIQGETAGRG
jgi:uncharacterized membrane protein YdbT with pleckstrin-like domain